MVLFFSGAEGFNVLEVYHRWVARFPFHTTLDHDFIELMARWLRDSILTRFSIIADNVLFAISRKVKPCLVSDGYSC